MPVPTSVNDLSTTAASNSPAGTESPVDGDNYIRALSSFVAQQRDQLNGTTPTTAFTITTLTFTTANGTTLNLSGNAAITGTLGVTGPTTLTDLTTTGNTVLGNASTDTLNVGNGGIVKDASNNIGLGVTPSAWGGVLNNAITEHRSGAWFGVQTTQPILFSGLNNYFDGTNFRYKNNGTAFLFSLNGQGHYFNWETAASGTAGNAATFTSRMQLSQAGLLDLKAGSGSLLVAGHITRFESSEQAAPSGPSLITVAHGGTRAPDVVQWFLRCKIAENGWSADDEHLMQMSDVGDPNRVYTTSANGTNVFFGFQTPGGGDRLAIRNSRGVGSQTQITNANWRLVAKCIWL